MGAPTVPLVRAWLMTRFRAALDASPYAAYPVTYGDPGGVAALKEAWVAVGCSKEPGVQRELRLVPDRTTNRKENYTLQVVIWTPVPGDWSSAGQQEATEQTWAIAGVLDNALRDADATGPNGNRNAGGLVNHLYISQFADSEYLDHTQRGAQIVLDISVTAQRT